MRAFVSSALLAMIVYACGGPSRPDPRTTVKDFFAAMQNSDTLYLNSSVDLAKAASTIPDDLAPDSLSPGAQSLLGALTGEGHLRKRWLSNQIVVGRSQQSGDSAWVEVSFIDRLTRVQYYNKMLLEFRGDHWMITSFKTL